MFRVWSCGDNDYLERHAELERKRKPARCSLKLEHEHEHEMEFLEGTLHQFNFHHLPQDPPPYLYSHDKHSSKKKRKMTEDSQLLEVSHSFLSSTLLNFQHPNVLEKVTLYDDENYNYFPIIEELNDITKDTMNGIYFAQKSLAGKAIKVHLPSVFSPEQSEIASQSLYSVASHPTISSSQQFVVTHSQTCSITQSNSLYGEVCFSFLDKDFILNKDKMINIRSSFVHEDFLRVDKEEDGHDHNANIWCLEKSQENRGLRKKPRVIENGHLYPLDDHKRFKYTYVAPLSSEFDDIKTIEASYAKLINKFVEDAARKDDVYDIIDLEDPLLSQNSFIEKFPSALSLILPNVSDKGVHWYRNYSDRLKDIFADRRGMVTRLLFSGQVYPYLAVKQSASIEDCKLLDSYETMLRQQRMVVELLQQKERELAFLQFCSFSQSLLDDNR